MRFHLVDRIDTLEPWTRIEAVKRTSSSETYWATDDYGRYMPLPIQLEVLAQSAAWLVYLSTERKHRAVLLSVGAVHTRSKVGPGDDVVAAADIQSAGDTIVVSGRLSVGDRTVLEVEDLMCALIDADLLEDTETVRGREEILRSGDHS
ncbi:3-hydroxylacyl-ACP dehydratase [Nocardia sp. XZ_19_385]|uniref:3-hydroxylacyl-ACP dehydratase n=1 Tax=Nocardia sp. XZ_19_385 TaxID=2769488 RepID=UPI00188F119C|nr:3-hydroxylacyl-ACP dehydratase [Nocardia sp. XZ_19_385]